MTDSELTREEVLKRDIPWETYMTAKLISSTGLQLLRRYDHRPYNVQAAMLEENGVAYVRVFVGILRDISKQETVEYMLAMVDEMLTANPKRARLFHDKSFQDNEDVYRPFIRLLSKKNWFIQEKSCKILTLIISARQYEEIDIEDPSAPQKKVDSFNEVLRGVVDWLISQLRSPTHPTRGIPTAVSSLATLLRLPEVRAMFIKADGTKLLAPLITPPSNQQNIQLLYEATLCIWLLSFHDGAVEAFSTARVVPRLVEVVKTSTKEKVVRVAVMAFRNLSNKGNFAAEMVDLGMLKVAQSLKLQAWSDEAMEATMVALAAPGASSLSAVTKRGAVVGAHQTSFMVGSGGVALKSSCGRAEEQSGSERRGVTLRVEAKGRRTAGVPGRQPNRQQMPSMPPMDADDNPKFVLFIRTLNVPRWYPLSVVTGGTTAKMMVGAMKNDWGKKLYEGTLTRNIAGVIYKDERQVRQTAIKQYPVLKSATGFQYGYKIMDAANPKSALFASDVIPVPPKEELNSVVDKVKDFFAKIGNSFGSLGGLPAGSEGQAGESKDKK